MSLIRFERAKGYENSDVELPTRATKGSAGYDIAIQETVVIRPYYKNILAWLFNHDMKEVKHGNPVSIDKSKVINASFGANAIYPTGVTVKLPQNKVALVLPRSSIGLKCLLTLPNNVGVIDSDYYPNSIGVGFINLGFKDVLIEKGTKVAQVIITDYYTTEDDVSEGTRTGGFGSTDKLNK